MKDSDKFYRDGLISFAEKKFYDKCDAEENGDNPTANESVVFLAYENENAIASEIELLACVGCRNKTFTARVTPDNFPELYCAACNRIIGRIGWAPG